MKCKSSGGTAHLRGNTACGPLTKKLGPTGCIFFKTSGKVLQISSWLEIVRWAVVTGYSWWPTSWLFCLQIVFTHIHHQPLFSKYVQFAKP